MLLRENWQNLVIMNAVDTGWVTDEDGTGKSSKDFQPPLGIVDCIAI
jgi:hypothetical protein